MKLLIPTKNQFYKWTIPTRIGYIAAVIGISVGGIQLCLWGGEIYKWSQPAPQILTAADKLVIDQNPTNLEIADVFIENFDSKHDMIVLTLKNPSTVTAKNVRIDFYNNLDRKSPYSEGLRHIDSGSGIDIPAGQTLSYRVAFLNDYENFFNPQAPGKKLIKVSKDINIQNPFELHNIVCGDSSSCSFSSNTISTIVNIKYGSIFDQRYRLLTQFYNTFLDGKITKS